MAGERTLSIDYTSLYLDDVEAGCSLIEAAERVANDYLGGKPRKRGKHKITRVTRDTAFWNSGFLSTLSSEAWNRESLVLALSRYMGQEPVSNPVLLEHIATIAPEAVRRAIRYSGLVLRKNSSRRAEIDHLAAILPDEFSDFVRVLDAFDVAYHQRMDYVEKLKQPLAGLSPLELLVYASLYAFEYLVPRDFLPVNKQAEFVANTEDSWNAINDLLIWKLSTADANACCLTENDIGKSLAIHMSPFLFPSVGGPEPREDLYGAFGRLLVAQIELNSFISRSANVFSYNDSITFGLKNNRLEIVKYDLKARDTWKRNGEKLNRLHNYWLYRAMDAFIESDLAGADIGKPENHEANRAAYIKAISTQLRLTEVYGLEEYVLVDSGLRVNLFQAHLSLELMTAFYNSEFILPYMQYLEETGNSRMALGRLAFGGLVQSGFQNRFPITWLDRASKITSIIGWTVSKDYPQGNPKAAEAILDFWTSDWAELANRLRMGQVGLHPEFFERPILKMGRYLFQLPWVVATQNNSSAAINNLRRIGVRRAEAREETRRIEEKLAKYFEQRDFRVKLNYHPVRTEDDDPGEVDLICARDGQVLVLEIKSTFLRRSPKDAWLHGMTTLRKAGLQLHHKVQAVRNALSKNDDFAVTLGIESGGKPFTIRGWIVDTSIECDHERFNGFLKVSLEEVLIALRDDVHLLNDPAGLLDGSWVESCKGSAENTDNPPTIYPNGFTAPSFIELIEKEGVWSELA